MPTISTSIWVVICSAGTTMMAWMILLILSLASPNMIQRTLHLLEVVVTCDLLEAHGLRYSPLLHTAMEDIGQQLQARFRFATQHLLSHSTCQCGQSASNCGRRHVGRGDLSVQLDSQLPEDPVERVFWRRACVCACVRACR